MASGQSFSSENENARFYRMSRDLYFRHFTLASPENEIFDTMQIMCGNISWADGGIKATARRLIRIMRTFLDSSFVASLLFSLSFVASLLWRLVCWFTQFQDSLLIISLRFKIFGWFFTVFQDPCLLLHFVLRSSPVVSFHDDDDDLFMAGLISLIVQKKLSQCLRKQWYSSVQAPP